MNDTSDKPHGPEHVASVGAYALAWCALLVLTATTVALARIDLGRWGLPAALSIAVAKAVLVALFFMHLRRDSPTLRAALVLALLVMGICYGLSFLDWGFRPQPGLPPAALQSSLLAQRGLH